MFISYNIVGLLVMVTSFLEPNSRGFFCDDETIKYPYRASTVGKGFLCIFYLLLPNVSVNILLDYYLYNMTIYK